MEIAFPYARNILQHNLPNSQQLFSLFTIVYKLQYLGILQLYTPEVFNATVFFPDLTFGTIRIQQILPFLSFFLPYFLITTFLLEAFTVFTFLNPLDCLVEIDTVQDFAPVTLDHFTVSFFDFLLQDPVTFVAYPIDLNPDHSP